MVVFPFALIAGVMLVGPGQAAILNYTMPLWASLLAVPVLSERLDRRTLMALGLGLAAVLLVLAGTATGRQTGCRDADAWDTQRDISIRSLTAPSLDNGMLFTRLPPFSGDIAIAIGPD